MSLLGRFLNVDGSLLLFLPLAHVFARVIQVGAVKTRAVVGHTADIKNLVADLGGSSRRSCWPCRGCSRRSSTPPRPRPRPTARARSSTGPPRPRSPSRGRRTRAAPASSLKAQHALFDKLVYGKLRAALGGRCLGAISGGAPLGDRLGHFFRGIGVTVFEGYGLTETTAAATVNHADGAEDRHGRPAAARRRRRASPTTARCWSAAASCSAATGTTRTPPRRRRLRRLVPHRRPRRARRRRLPEDHRPQEGDHRHRGRQERRPRRARGPAARAPPGQPVHGRRRRAAVHRAR